MKTRWSTSPAHREEESKEKDFYLKRWALTLCETFLLIKLAQDAKTEVEIQSTSSGLLCESGWSVNNRLRIIEWKHAAGYERFSAASARTNLLRNSRWKRLEIFFSAVLVYTEKYFLTLII